MSGFDVRYYPAYSLTVTYMRWLHREYLKTWAGCWRGCDSSEDGVLRHLKEAGFQVEVAPPGSFWLVQGPGIVEGSTDQLFEALRGSVSDGRGVTAPASWLRQAF
jgi:hypothetical protein